MRLTSSVVLPVPAAASTTSVSSRSSTIVVAGRLVDHRRASALRHYGLSLNARRSPSFSGDLRRTRSSSSGPQTGRKSHHVHARFDGRGRQEAELDRAIDDLERLEPDPAVRLADRDLVIDEAAGGGAVEQAAGPDRSRRAPARSPGCTARAAGSLRRQSPSFRRPVLAGLVIGDAQQAAARLRSIRSTDPRSLKRPSTSTGSGTLRGSCVLVGRQAEAELEVLGQPVLDLGQAPDPDAEVRAMSPISSRHTRSIAGASFSA